MNWLPPTGGTRFVYDTLRSLDAADFSTHLRCIESSDGNDQSSMDEADPGSGNSYFYLIRPENRCGVGTVGFSSNSLERSAGNCP